MSISQQQKRKFFNEGHHLPICVNQGCGRNVVVREWKYWSFKSECSRCTSARKNGKILEDVKVHKKTHCENSDGHLGFYCPVENIDSWVDFQNGLDLDHTDGDHSNNIPQNVKTYCKLCHGRKGREEGDFDSNKESGRLFG